MRRIVLLLLLLVAPSLRAEPAASTDPVEQFFSEARAYQELKAQFDEEIKYQLNQQVERQKTSINKSYDQATGGLEDRENDRRGDAIERLQEFLQRYPDNPVYTPDALFRLAELYYERAQVDYSTAEEQFDTEYDLYRRGKLPRPPKAPLLALDASIGLYEQLVTRYPTYRYIDAAYYLLGYCYINSDKYDEAAQAYQTLVDKYPKSKYVDEGWLRVGELHFDMGEWSKAIEAYQHVLDYPQSKFYELAFYKLAWAYFQADQYPTAIARFQALLDYYEKNPDKAQEERVTSLRAEVIEYIAKTLAEDDWDGDGQRDPDAGMQRGVRYLKEDRPYNRDILHKYADTLYELHERPKYAEAIGVYQQLLAVDPTAPDSLEVQERVVAIHDIMGDVEGGIRERERMVSAFGRGSPWHNANQGNVEAIKKADAAVEKFAEERALALHQSAQKTKVEAQVSNDATRLALAEKLYRDASAAYQRFLEQYPNAANSYEMTFYLAETLYYSRQYEAAATYYEKVRDFPGKEEYLEYAAYSAIVSLQTQIEDEIKAGRIPKWALAKEIEEVKEVQGNEEQQKKGIKRVTARPVAPLVEHYVRDIDEYAKRNLNRKDDPEMQAKLAYRAAEVYLRHKNYDEARRRFEEVVNKYPALLVANYAAANIINTYWEENDIDNVKKWAKLIEEKNIGKPEERKKWKEDIRVFEMGASFDHAMKLLEEKQHVAAAQEFISLVNANPDFEDADKALLNAAQSLQDAHRYEESAQVFERVVTDPSFRNSQYHERALFSLSENYKKFYNFDKAIWGYKTLYEKYPKSENAPYSLFQAAELFQYNQQYDQAIPLFEQYTKVFRARPDSAGVAWRVIALYEKEGDERKLVDALRGFIAGYYDNPGVAAQVVEAHLKLANLYLARGDERNARQYYQKTVQEFDRRGFQPGSPQAAFASEARFQLVEYDFRVYEAIKLVGSVEAQGAAIARKQRMLGELEKKYADVFPYKALDWTVAAYFRTGQIYQLFAKALYDAPVPDMAEEEMEIYRTELEDAASKWENTAIERYETTITNARALNVMNDWTKKTLEALNAYKPAEYPLFKEEKKFFLTDLQE